MKRLCLKTAVACMCAAALTAGGLAMSANGFAQGNSSLPDVLPSLSNAGAWHVETAVSLYVRAGELSREQPDTFGAAVQEVDTTDAEAQITPMKTINLTDGHTYTVTMKARADGIHPIRIFAQTDGKNPHYVGLNIGANPGFPYETIRKTFVARNVNGSAVRFGIAIGSTTGRVWIQDLTMTDDTPTLAASSSP